MTDFDQNSLADRAERQKGFTQIVSGADRYRLKSIQESEALYEWPDEERYADDGTLQLVNIGEANTFRQVLVLTADEIDTVDPPTNTRTISYYIYQKQVLKNRVQVIFREVEESEASSTKYLIHQYTGDIQKVGKIREQTGGVFLLEIEGRITAFTSYLRKSSA